MAGFQDSGSPNFAQSGAVFDPIVPTDGTQNITGALASTGDITGGDSSGAHIVGLKTSGAWSSGSGFSAVDSTRGPTLLYSTDANCGAELIGKQPDAANAIAVKTNSTVNMANATARILSVQNNSVEKVAFGPLGQITPGADISGAVKLTWVGRGAYVIDFPAFSAGVDSTSAQTLTGVAFGDCLTVGCSIDQSAAIGQMTAMVTSAGNIKITVSPTTTVSVADPASATYTVTAIRSA